MKKFSEQDLCKLSDEEVVALAKKGDMQAANHIIVRYRNLIYKFAGMYYISGGDREDLAQEGRIGVYNAIKSYDEHQSQNFFSFASLCINRRIISAVRAANRKKNLPLSTYISLSDAEFENAVAPAECEPLGVVLEKERTKRLRTRMNECLSSFELKVLHGYISGMSYAEIASSVGKNQKAVDNAICRIKKKLVFLFCDNNA